MIRVEDFASRPLSELLCVACGCFMAHLVQHDDGRWGASLWCNMCMENYYHAHE